MKPFNLQLALQGDPVITRDGRRVMDIKCSDDSPVLEVTVDGIVNFFAYKDGHVPPYNESARDLFMAEPGDLFWPFPIYDLDKHVHHGIGSGATTGPIKETPYAIKALQDAAKIMEERGKQYDTEGGERSMAACVTMFNAATKHDLTESEGWLLMECLKLVRLFQRPGYHEDSAHDNIAYAALLAESKSKEK